MVDQHHACTQPERILRRFHIVFAEVQIPIAQLLTGAGKVEKKTVGLSADFF
jgi:hypothetical protein